MSDARGADNSGQPIILDFDDNRLLALLFGEHDRHLARIEERIGVAVASRGNRLMITGPAEAQAQAICMQTQDFARAYHAFVAKQKPVFEGN